MSNIYRLLYWLLATLRNFWLQLMAVIRPRSSKCPFMSPNCNEAETEQHSTVNRKLGKHDHALPFKKMPTAKGLPLIGTTFDLMAAGAAPKLHKYIDKRHQELGPIFRERLGGAQDAVFVASASLMRQVFLYEGQHPKHPLPDAWTLYNNEFKCQRGLFFMDGSEWQQNRRLLNKFLLNGNMDWINEHIDDCTIRFVNSLRAQVANSEAEYTEIEDLEQQLYRWAIQVICAIMFGAMPSTVNTKEIDLALNEFSRIVSKIFECSSLLMNFPPKLAKLLNLRMWQDFETNVSHVLCKGSDIIDMYIALNVEHEEKIATKASQHDINGSERLFSMLQQAGMSLDMIKRIFVDLVIAAGDTTAYTSEWALYLLSQNQTLQKKIAEEAQLHDSKDMPTVRGFIKETLRLFPVAPFIGRYLACDAVLGNYCIKKDTLVLLSLYTAGRDAAHFPNPTAVNPERWLRDETTGELQGVLQAHGSMPFAIGNRSCIGRKVAAVQLESLISAISINFELKCLNEKPIDCILRLVTVPDATLKLSIKLRSGIC